MTSPTSSPAAVSPPHPTIAPDLVPERRGAVVVLSHNRRDGDWILPRLFRVFAFWGNAEIDLTKALVSPGTSEIEIRCIMASIEIVIPPDLRVESEVDAVMGSAEVRRQVASTTAPDAPCIRVTGSTFLGSVEIRVVDPNAPGLLERIRRRVRGAS
jgi:hypothetical protein